MGVINIEWQNPGPPEGLSDLVGDFPDILTDLQRVEDRIEFGEPYLGMSFDYDEQTGVYAYPIYSPYSEEAFVNGEVPAGVFVYRAIEIYNTVFIWRCQVIRGFDWPRQRDSAFRRALDFG